MTAAISRPWVLAAILHARGHSVADLSPEELAALLDELVDEGIICVRFGNARSARVAEPRADWERALPVLDRAWDDVLARAGLRGQVTINVRLDTAGRRLLDGLPSSVTLPTGEPLRLHPDLDIGEERPVSRAPGRSALGGRPPRRRAPEYSTRAEERGGGWDGGPDLCAPEADFADDFADDLGAEPEPVPVEAEAEPAAEAEPEVGPETGAEAGAEPETEAEAEAGAEPEPSGPDQRRLQARVKDAEGTTLTAGFLAGQKHRVSVRIAAEVAEDAAVARTLFPSPTPGRPVTLDVVLRVQSAQSAPVKRTLRLPATADSGWTRDAELDLPPTGRKATIEITVLHQGRAVQTALLSGPLRRTLPSRRARSGFALSIDETTAPSATAERSAAGATVMVSAPAKGTPLVFDPLKQRVPFDAGAITAAGQELRSLLYAALAAPPESLEAAAPVLTRLAILGATLHRHLVAATGTQLAEADWIHVVQVGTNDIPFELAYAHPMPARDDEVPVCAPARAGATGCAADCADRRRNDRICPFGFWGTSKVVERRLHVAGRRSSVASQPRVSLATGAVVATAKVTDRVDKHASARIAAAIRALVAPGTCEQAKGWDDLARGVQAGPGMIVLVTHTSGEGALGTTVEIGTEPRPTYRLDSSLINPGLREPGPVVLSIGCDTGHLDAGFASWVQTVQDAQASVVVSALSPVPGHAVADFVERFASVLAAMLAEPGQHRCGAALTAARQQTLAAGDLLGLALTATGDGDISLVGR